jgi:heme/copper-type cytochrome/quinol oxidase subunit 2
MREDTWGTSAMNLVTHLRPLALAALAVTVLLLAGDVALACPTCKDQLAHDAESANLARGFYYSIVFMLSMPPLIFGSLAAYFYWEIRRARTRQATAA